MKQFIPHLHAGWPALLLLGAAVACLAAQEAAAKQALGEMRALLTQLRAPVTDAQEPPGEETAEGEFGRKRDLMADLQRLVLPHSIWG